MELLPFFPHSLSLLFLACLPSDIMVARVFEQTMARLAIEYRDILMRLWCLCLINGSVRCITSTVNAIRAYCWSLFSHFQSWGVARVYIHRNTMQCCVKNSKITVDVKFLRTKRHLHFFHLLAEKVVISCLCDWFVQSAILYRTSTPPLLMMAKRPTIQ